MKMILTYILKDLGYVLICTLPLAFYNTKETCTYVRLLPETYRIRLEYKRTRTGNRPSTSMRGNYRQNQDIYLLSQITKQHNRDNFALLHCTARIMFR